MTNLSIPPQAIIPQVRTAPVYTPPVVTAPAPVPQPQLTRQDINATYDAAVKVTQAASEQTYAVSDQKFAIFKDASGQTITRYVSLRDGSVTYEPAPSYAKAFLPPVSFNV